MTFAIFTKHKRTPAELATKLSHALESLASGGADKVRAALNILFVFILVRRKISN
jgi:hypothetical protein